MDQKNPLSNISILKGILNGMDAFLYVTDPQTDEILFINDKMKEHFGVEGSGIGEICWKVLRKDMTSRCDFCPVYQLNKNPDEAVNWEIANPFTGRVYKCTDRFIQWTENRLVHFQHCVDVTDMKDAEHTIMERLEQQELMTAMSQSFISTDSMESLVENALKMAGEFMKVSFIVMMTHNPKDKTLVVKSSWNNKNCPHDSDSMPFHAGTLEYDSFVSNHMSDIVFDDISEVPSFTYLSQCGVKSFVQVPLIVDGDFWGIISFNECRSIRRWTESNVQLVRLIGSILAGLIEQKKMEERYIQMADLVNSSPQCIACISSEGKIEFANQGCLDMFGYTYEETIGNNLSLIFDEQNLNTAMNVLIPKILKEGKIDIELPVIRKDREVRLLSVSAFVSVLNKQIINVIAVDITEKKRLEGKLIVAMEEAEASNRAKSEFLSRMSHEMRTPMNAIIGMTRIAKSSKDSVRKEYCLDKIDESSVHLLGVINDILDMSKIEAGKLELSETEFHFERMLIRTVDVVKFKIEEKKQKLVVHIDPRISNFVIADEQRLTQVITNLLSNAVKFTPEGGTITLTVENINYEKDYIVKKVTVSDTGIGISKKQQESLFQSFEQADGSISRKFGGTGLGLVISKKIIELMNGKIWIESELGEGASFIFEIPAKKGVRDRSSLMDPAIDWKNLRILAVDDNQNNLDYLKGLSLSIGFFCETAICGEEALDKIDQNRGAPFDMILIDWDMPAMNGIKLTQKILSYDVPSVLVIMTTFSTWDDIEKEAKRAGVHSFLSKPLFSSNVINCINTNLRPKNGVEETFNTEDAQEKIFDGFRILLAEDVEINQEIVMSLLENTGIIIDTAENGLEAVKLFEENSSSYHAVLMDIHMPELDGYEATHRIRQLNRGNAKSIPIIAMTANVFKEDIEKCLQAGMNDHVGKPIDFNDLMNKLKTYLLPG